MNKRFIAETYLKDGKVDMSANPNFVLSGCNSLEVSYTPRTQLGIDTEGYPIYSVGLTESKTYEITTYNDISTAVPYNCITIIVLRDYGDGKGLALGFCEDSSAWFENTAGSWEAAGYIVQKDESFLVDIEKCISIA